MAVFKKDLHKTRNSSSFEMITTVLAEYRLIS